MKEVLGVVFDVRGLIPSILSNNGIILRENEKKFYFFNGGENYLKAVVLVSAGTFGKIYESESNFKIFCRFGFRTIIAEKFTKNFSEKAENAGMCLIAIFKNDFNRIVLNLFKTPSVCIENGVNQKMFMKFKQVFYTNNIETSDNILFKIKSEKRFNLSRYFRNKKSIF